MAHIAQQRNARGWATTGRQPEHGLAIDGAHALDRDDAVMVRRTATGFRVAVHICDPTGLVAVGSVLDRRARALGRTSYRGREAVQPMLGAALPRAVGLADQQPRPTITLTCEVDHAGHVVSNSVARSVTTCAVVSYADTRAALTDDAHRLHKPLAAASDCAQTLLGHRRDRGALVSYDPLRGLASDEEGRVRQLDSWERHPGHLIVQELMILANERLAGWCAERGVPALYRNQRPATDAPDRSVLLAELDALTSGRLSLEHVQRREALLLRATYGTRAEGHFGLNVPVYSHLTSPLRRYADLATLRNVVAELSDATAWPHPEAELETIAEEIVAGDAAAGTTKALARRRRHLAHARATAASTPDPASAESRSFYGVLSLAVSDVRVGAERTSEVLRRFAAGSINARDALVALLDIDGSPPGDAAVQQGALQALASAPGLAAAVLAGHAATAGAGSVDYDEHRHGWYRTPTFSARASYAGRTGARRHARLKKRARQLAALSLLAALSDQPDPSGDEPPRPWRPDAAVEVPSATGPRAISALHEYATRMRAPVAWTFEVAGPTHQPTFQALVTLQLPDGDRHASGTGPSKATAKADAAAALLAALAAGSPPGS